jgi:ADP-ribose pyrophosphatase YjhB (NUDIX family)
MPSLQRTPARHREETSAGGLVIDLSTPEPRVALIARSGRDGTLRWCLPKGHLEAGETFEQTAEREVQEETGLSCRVLAPLGTIDFWFTHDGDRIHKTVHHFVLECTGGDLSDADIEVDQVSWFPLVDVSDVLAHRDERDLIKGQADLLADPHRSWNSA